MFGRAAITLGIGPHFVIKPKFETVLGRRIGDCGHGARAFNFVCAPPGGVNTERLI